MNNQNKTVSGADAENVPQKRGKAESIFELVILAAQRSRQLVNGANPRVAVPNKNPRNTYTAIKEIRSGLIGYKGNYDE